MIQWSSYRETGVLESNELLMISNDIQLRHYEVTIGNESLAVLVLFWNWCSRIWISHNIKWYKIDITVAWEHHVKYIFIVLLETLKTTTGYKFHRKCKTSVAKSCLIVQRAETGLTNFDSFAKFYDKFNHGFVINNIWQCLKSPLLGGQSNAAKQTIFVTAIAKTL